MNKETLIKLLLSTFLGLIGGSVAYTFTQASSFGVLVGWDFFALTYMIVSIAVFARIPQTKIAERCAKEDLRSWLLFLIVVLVCSICLGVVLSFFEARKRMECCPVDELGSRYRSYCLFHGQSCTFLLRFGMRTSFTATGTNSLRSMQTG